MAGAGSDVPSGRESSAAVLERTRAALERRDREVALVHREIEAVRRALEFVGMRADEPTHVVRFVTEEVARRKAVLARRESATDVAEVEVAEACDDLANARRRSRELEARVDQLRRRLRLIATRVGDAQVSETAFRALGVRRRGGLPDAPVDDELVTIARALRDLAGRCEQADAALDEVWAEEAELRRIFARDVSDRDRGLAAPVLEAVSDLLHSGVHLDELTRDLQRQAAERGSELAVTWRDIAAVWERRAALRQEAARLAETLDSVAGAVGDLSSGERP